jgi:hypothetical protein
MLLIVGGNTQDLQGNRPPPIKTSIYVRKPSVRNGVVVKLGDVMRQEVSLWK